VRALVAIVAVAGCHNHGTVAVDAVPVDAVAGNPCPVGTPQPPSAPFATSTISYTTDASDAFAFAELTTAANQLGYAPVAQQPPANVSFGVPAGQVVSFPHLAPEGDEVFVRQLDPNVGATLRRYVSATSSWTGPYTGGPLGIDGTTVVNNIVVPGVPTPRSSGHRRMMIDLGSVMFAELVEIAIDQWMTVKTYDRGQLGISDGVIAHPALTADGLRLVFVVTLGTGSKLVATASRHGTSAPFVLDAEAWFVAPAGASTPYLTADCSTLYYSDDAQNVVAVPIAAP